MGSLSGVVLQGGGALGAFEYGALSRLYEDSQFKPDVISGVSIGAINAAVVVSNPDDPVSALAELWERLTVMGPAYISRYGNYGMYTVNMKMLWMPQRATSIYDTSPLYHLLKELVDIDKLNSSEIELFVTAVNVRTGKIREFSNRDSDGLSYSKIVASGSLPPGFPMTKIDDECYWDAGLVSNTPFGTAIRALEKIGIEKASDSTHLYVIKLFPDYAEVPEDMGGVFDRMMELLFSSSFEHDKKLFAKRSAYSDLIKKIELIASSDNSFDSIRQSQAYQELLYTDPIILHEVEHIGEEGAAAASDFSASAIQKRFDEGYRAAMQALSKKQHSHLLHLSAV